MKNYLLLVCLCMSLFTHAQFSAGQKMIGGQIGINYSNNEYNGAQFNNQIYNQFNTSFSFSRFKSPLLFSGFGLSYSYNDNHQNDLVNNTQSINRSHSIGAFVSATRLQLLAKKFYLGFTGTSGLSYGFGKNTYPVNNDYTTSKNYNINVNGNLGLFYQLNERFIINTSLINLINLSYNYYEYYPNLNSGLYQTKSSSFNISSGLNGFSLSNISFGVRYMLKQAK